MNFNPNFYSNLYFNHNHYHNHYLYQLRQQEIAGGITVSAESGVRIIQFGGPFKLNASKSLTHPYFQRPRPGSPQVGGKGQPIDNT
jgi:hypothetical protein